MKPLVVGNWKMNPGTVREAERISRNIASRGKSVRADIVICPPFPYLSRMPSRLSLGAQDMFQEKEGAYTGSVSASMLKSMKIRYVLIGHSERRRLGDTEDIVRGKLRLALDAGLRPIFCLGEDRRDDDVGYFQVIKEQLRSAFLGLPRALVDRVVVAYEPVWAIGTEAKGILTGEDALHTRLFVRKVLADLVGERGRRIPILYGGSVSADNAEELYRSGGWDGFLVGRDSLVPDNFLTIARATTLRKK